MLYVPSWTAYFVLVLLRKRVTPRTLHLFPGVLPFPIPDRLGFIKIYGALLMGVGFRGRRMELEKLELTGWGLDIDDWISVNCLVDNCS